MKVLVYRKFKTGKLQKNPFEIYDRVSSLEEAKELFLQKYLYDLDNFGFVTQDDDPIPSRDRDLTSIAKKYAITPELFEAWEKSLAKTSALEGHITARIDYIAHALAKAFGNTLNYWSIYKYESEDGGPVSDLFQHDGEFLSSLEIEFSSKDDLISDNRISEHCFIDKTGKTCNIFDYGIPKRWVFEDFEEELTKGVDLYIEKMVKEREERSRKKLKERDEYLRKQSEKEAILETLKSKLDEKELEAIGLK